MTIEHQIKHLESLRSDAREEIVKRIEQRDKYSVQLTIALTAIVGIAFSRPELTMVLIAAPLSAVYFTVLILYSYRIHGIRAMYIKTQIEPQLADLTGLTAETEWEIFYASRLVPGIRRRFFILALWIVLFVTLAYLAYFWAFEEQTRRVGVAIGIATPIYLAVVAGIHRHFKDI